ncbi:MAG: hypothetical protein RBU30_03460 [Polyangia bacterium]|jgi:hypothetical protein|nr:hypothetical protein [Polyangia bacterium]
MPENTPSAERPDAAPAGLLEVRLVRGDELTGELTPLALPDEAELGLLDVSGALVDHLHTELVLGIAAGRHVLPVTESESIEADVARETKCSLWLSATRGLDQRDGEALVTAAELTFEPALTLHNVWPVLAQLHTIFKDRDLTALKTHLQRVAQSPAADAALLMVQAMAARLEQRSAQGVIEESERSERIEEQRARIASGLKRMWSGLQGVAGLFQEELKHRAGQLPAVFLQRVTAHPVRQGETWLLQLRFSGELGYPGGIRSRFTDVALPTTVLPAPHARLSALLSGAPLATAELVSARLPMAALARALGRLPLSVQGHMDALLWAPAVRVSVPTPSLGETATEIRFRDRVRIRGGIEAQVKADRLALQLHNLEIGASAERLHLDAQAEVRLREGAALSAGAVLPHILEALAEGRRTDEELTYALAAALDDRSVLEGVEVHASLRHPWIGDGSGLALNITRLNVAGRFRMDTARPRGESVLEDIDLRYGAHVELPQGSQLDDGVLRLEPGLIGGKLEGRVTRTAEGGIAIQVNGRTGFSLGGGMDVEAFPELDIETGAMSILASGDLRFEGRLRTGPISGRTGALIFDGSEAELRLQEALLSHGLRELVIPRETRLVARVIEGNLDTAGLGRGLLELSWDLDGRSPVLRDPGKQVEVFVPELRKGTFRLGISPVGGVSISGSRGGLYDAHFWNALVNPGAEIERWLQILDDDEAMEKVLGVLGVFSRRAAEQLSWLRDQSKRVRRILEGEGIREVGDFLPAHTIARVLSKILVKDLSIEDEIYVLVKQVTDGMGLDVVAVKQLLAEHLPEHEYDYELDRGLRLAARLLAPTEPLLPRERETLIPLVEREDYLERYAALPDGGAIARVLSDPAPLPAAFAERLARVAPYLTLAQLDWMISLERTDWPAKSIRWVRTVHALKERVHEIAESYGGIAFIPQAWAISFFLGEAVRTRPDAVAPPISDDDGYPLASGLLGPREVAVLLQAGLASLFQGGPPQVNQRLLLDYAIRQPAGFLRDVLVEMAGRSPRALTGVLYALIQMEQGRLTEPIDLPALLSERLGISVPRLEDYMAGGRWARESHYEALSRSAELILAEAEPYFALLERLQVARHEVSEPIVEKGGQPRLVAAATDAIAEADRVGSSCAFTGGAKEKTRQRQAVDAYDAAFQACRRLIEVEPEAFKRDWFKEFWARNHEALVIRSVVKNVKEDVDQVRAWLRARSGADLPDGDQALVDAVIDALYFFEADRAKLRADPLVRLLIDPPEGLYDFTIVSAMGVITEGARGNELQEAYKRLETQRGVRTLRADTQTARSLDFNAERIEEAVRQSEGPWGYIGYSQGCPNGLRAEALLLGGTPDQQGLAARLVSRNLLFSATNGSAHGTCGDMKFLRAMIDLDRFLKHYQAVFSSRAIRLALSNIGLLLDSKPFVHSLGGVDSLSHTGVAALARDGQWKTDVPTSIVRGIVETATLPEALEMLSNVLTKQIESDQHDTQVTITEAVGHPVWVQSPMGEVLKGCDMGCLVQRTHHWSPLKDATSFVTTPRDRALYIYDFPKDRHVFPWVEVNVRFGIIGVRS